MRAKAKLIGHRLASHFKRATLNRLHFFPRAHNIMMQCGRSGILIRDIFKVGKNATLAHWTSLNFKSFSYARNSCNDMREHVFASHDSPRSRQNVSILAPIVGESKRDESASVAASACCCCAVALHRLLHAHPTPQPRGPLHQKESRTWL